MCCIEAIAMPSNSEHNESVIKKTRGFFFSNFSISVCIEWQDQQYNVISPLPPTPNKPMLFFFALSDAHFEGITPDST